MIGAGLAGAASAAALAARGWQVHLIDERGPAQGEGSSQPLCAEHLHLSPDDNLAARLTRAALLLAAQTRWTGRSADAPVGRLVLAADEDEMQAQRRLAAALAFPPAFVQALDATQASDRAGIRLPRGGLWLPMATAQRPAELCARWIDDAAVRLSTGLRVGRIAPADPGWASYDTQGRLIGCSDVLILANADDAVRLASLTSARPRRIAGQTTWLTGRDITALRCTLGGGAYACPAGDGRVLIGATFEEADGFVASDAGDRVNVERFAALIGRAPGSLAVTPAGHVPGTRCAMPDRMPMIGLLPDEARIDEEAARLANDARLPMPRRAGLYGVFALGARGLLHAPLAAELIAAQLDGEPLPIEADLLAAIDPARYATQRLRRTARPRRAG
ncbi:MAG TPA: FAD-dependent 5-carboxymethylaminomethyl-2-thiouridine(34) oxidoreductase MnmC [Burkholderiaceae bacterium]|nr:FAD-dependent 5-carboxymethylaminomethyl-2-thiouridine(34) oxidoreductase MnmC [Burkholderiaceae bacterium]